MKNKQFLLIMLLLLTLIFSFAQNAAAQGMGQIKGTVTSYYTEKPLIGVTVYFYGEGDFSTSVVTDYNGEYSSGLIPAYSNYTVSFEKYCFITKSQTNISVGSGGTTTINENLVYNCTCTISEPSSGDVWNINDNVTIQWQCADEVDNFVSIEVGRRASGCGSGYTWTTIVQNTPNNGSYNWTVNGPANEDCVIRICGVAICKESYSFIINTRPTAGYMSVSPNPANEGQQITFCVNNCSDADAGDSIDGYGFGWTIFYWWKAGVNCQTSTAPNTAGTYTIYGYCWDTHSANSNLVSTVLTVN